MKLIIGLGNPGSKYKNTRHNFGFMTIDVMRQDLEFENWLEKKHLKSMISRGSASEAILVLAKPTTFMNKSGDAVKALINEFEPSAGELIIIHDDADLNLGTIKLEENRGAGGHHGIESIIAKLETNNFQRLRLGIRTAERDASDLTDYALRPFREEEKTKVEEIICNAITLIKDTF